MVEEHFEQLQHIQYISASALTSNNVVDANDREITVR